MIHNISLTTVWVKDIDGSKASYVDKLGFEPRDDVRLGDDFRWCTIGHPSQPEDRPYGVEALIRDNTGNWLVLVEPREFSQEEMEAFAGDDPSSLNPLAG
jgi:catechol 2,3-dioxygenase-like lactoylglutathione lyase family enzyme